MDMPRSPNRSFRVMLYGIIIATHKWSKCISYMDALGFLISRANMGFDTLCHLFQVPNGSSWMTRTLSTHGLPPPSWRLELSLALHPHVGSRWERKSAKTLEVDHIWDLKGKQHFKTACEHGCLCANNSGEMSWCELCGWRCLKGTLLCGFPCNFLQILDAWLLLFIPQLT